MTQTETLSPPPDVADSGGPELTPRQLEILALLKAGKANKDIAYELGIGLGTVKQHVVALFKKLNVTNRAMAVGKGYQLAGRTGSAPAEAAFADVVESALELRPACVLSLAANGEGDGAWRLLQNAATAATSDEDATLVARPASSVDILFGLNRVHENDADRARRVACNVARGLAEAAAATGLPRPALHAGLASGYLVASIERKGGWTGETVAGRLIGDARALRAAAPPDTLIADGAAVRMIAFARRADGEEAPEDDAPARFPLGQQPRRRRRRPADAPALIGRDRELAALDDHLARLRGGKGGLVWLEGEAGMGKTTLAEAFGRRCQASGVRWWECRCQHEVLLCEALMALAGQRGRPSDPPLELVVEAIRKAAAAGPLALMIDDIHLARPKEAALTIALATLTREEPLLLLGVGRSLRPHQLRDLPGDAVIKLGHLAANDVRTLVHRLSTHRLHRRTVEPLVELAQGVPLFAAELTREALRHRKEPRSAEPHLPLSLAVLVLSRLDRLGLDRMLLRLAANPASADITSLRGLWPGTPDALEEEIERAVRAGILMRTDGDGVGFAHPMVRAVLRHVLLAGQRDLPGGLPGRG